jgi:hypothetical protein
MMEEAAPGRMRWHERQLAVATRQHIGCTY